MATLAKHHERESQELHPWFETDENKGENSRAPRTVTEIYTAPCRRYCGDVNTCFFTGALSGTSTDLLVNRGNNVQRKTTRHTWFITRRGHTRVTLVCLDCCPLALPMSSPSSHTLDHVVHLTPPGSFHDTAEQFRQLGFKFVFSPTLFFCPLT